MFSSFKTSFIFVAVLSAIASSAIPVKRQTQFDFKSKMFAFDPSKNECNIPASPNTPAIQISRNIFFSGPMVGGAAQNGFCGPTGIVFTKDKRQIDVTIVGICDNCAQIDFQASEAVFKALGGDPKKTFEGVEFLQ